jgi:hypothetical protein
VARLGRAAGPTLLMTRSTAGTRSDVARTSGPDRDYLEAILPEEANPARRCPASRDRRWAVEAGHRTAAPLRKVQERLDSGFRSWSRVYPRAVLEEWPKEYRAGEAGDVAAAPSGRGSDDSVISVPDPGCRLHEPAALGRARCVGRCRSNPCQSAEHRFHTRPLTGRVRASAQTVYSLEMITS